VLKNLTPQYVEIKIQDISATTKLIEGEAQMSDGKPNVSAKTVGLLVPMVSLLGIKTESLKKILIATTLVYNFIV
jgi:hypothetical protein